MAFVFAYGTLQIPELMGAVTGRSFPAQTAVLNGYACCRLKGYSFPGIRPRHGAHTKGLLYAGVDQASLSRLDHFEDDFYVRRSLPVEVEDGGKLSAEVYVIADGHAGLVASQAWSLEDLRPAELQYLLETCRTGQDTGHDISRKPTERLSKS